MSGPRRDFASKKSQFDKNKLIIDSDEDESGNESDGIQSQADILSEQAQSNVLND